MRTQFRKGMWLSQSRAVNYDQSPGWNSVCPHFLPQHNFLPLPKPQEMRQVLGFWSGQHNLPNTQIPETRDLMTVNEDREGNVGQVSAGQGTWRTEWRPPVVCQKNQKMKGIWASTLPHGNCLMKTASVVLLVQTTPTANSYFITCAKNVATSPLPVLRILRDH